MSIIVTSKEPTVSDIVTVTAAVGLTVTHGIMKIVSDGGTINITANPQISPGKRDGQPLKVVGTSDTNKVIFDDGDGLSMSTSVTVSDKGVIDYHWSVGENEWIMDGSDTK